MNEVEDNPSWTGLFLTGLSFTALASMLYLLSQHSEGGSGSHSDMEPSEELDFVDHAGIALRELKFARNKAECGVCRRLLEEAEEMVGDRYEKLRTIKTMLDIMEEEGISSWDSLSEEEKRNIKERAKKRIEELKV